MRHKHFCRANPVNKFSCNLCEKSFSRQWYLDTHIKKLHPKHMLNCDNCSAAFTQGAELEAHERQCFVPDLQCRLCGKLIPIGVSLSVHLEHHCKQHMITPWQIALDQLAPHFKPRTCTGREYEKRWLEQWLKNTPNGMIFLSGDVGSGKTHVINLVTTDMQHYNPGAKTIFVDCFSWANFCKREVYGSLFHSIFGYFATPAKCERALHAFFNSARTKRARILS